MTPLLEMPRKNAGYRIDERCIEALRLLAERTDTSINLYLERLIFEHGKVQGVIPKDEKPLGELRGGLREGAGRPKDEADGE